MSTGFETFIGVSMGDRPKRIAKRIGCAGIVAAAAVSLGLGVHHGVAFTTSFLAPKSAGYWNIYTRQQLECVFRDIRKQVPQGVTAYVHGPDNTLTFRMAELSTPWLEPQESSPSTAQWRLFLVYVPPRTQCHGLELEAYHV
jgi:hypothetical protein